MARIIKDNPPDLGEMIVKKMIEVVKYCQKDTNYHGLPYAMLVTNNFLSHVIVFKNEQVDEKCTMARFDELSLTQMHYILNKNTREWVKNEKRKSKGKAQVEEDVEEKRMMKTEVKHHNK